MLGGRLDEGLALLDEAARKAHPVHLHCPLALGHALLQAKRPTAARTIAADVASKTRRSGDRGTHAWALRLEGEIAVSASAATRAGTARTALEAEAEARYRGALALATELGMRPLVAHCHLGLGGLPQTANLPASSARGKCWRHHQHSTVTISRPSTRRAVGCSPRSPAGTTSSSCHSMAGGL